MAGIKTPNDGLVVRKVFFIILMLLLVFSMSMFVGCGGGGSNDSSDEIATTDTDTDSSSDTDSGTTSDTDSSTASDTDSNTTSSGSSSDGTSLGDDYDEADYTWDSSEVAYISLDGGSISESTDGASVSGSELTISSAGTYSISGSLADGRIVVATEDEDVVRLIFNGIDVTCSNSAPVYIESAERVAIILADGSSNILTDAATYIYDEADEDEPNAALHSKAYLTIGGSGTLTVNARYNDGITGKDGFVIDSGTITVNAVDDGIRGKDYLIIKSGNIAVTTDSGDGLLSDNEEDTDKGYIIIEDGVITIDAGGDAIQAETLVTVYDGDFTLTSGGGSSTSFISDDSKKGIKGVAGVMIDGGYFVIDSMDDAVHSNDFIEINDGTFGLSTGDDGIHADNTVDIYGGDFSIWKSYEGIESSVITIGDGNYYIQSSDDGLNCAGGNDGSGMMGPGGGFTPDASGDYHLYIDGGYIAIYSNGDSLDSNGSIEMNGGTVIVHAPSNDNGALDYGSSFVISGGFLVTAGGPGMGESPSTSSTQNYKKLTFSQRSAGTLIHIESSGGTDLVTFEPAKKYSVFIISTPDLEDGTSYNVYFGGSYSGGTETDGLYEGGTYSGSTQDSSLSFSM